MNPVALDDGRPAWNSAKAFVLTVAGGGSGLGNFFRLPFMFVAFGVGNFYIAFILALFLVAFPVSVLEIFLGHHYRRASAGALSAVHAKAAGLGYAMPFVGAAVVAVYASVLLCWTIYPFMIDSFSSNVPYSVDTPSQIRAYLDRKGVFYHDEDAKVFLVLAAVWGAACLLAARGVRTIMIAVYFTVPIPLLFVLALMIYSMAVASMSRVGVLVTPSWKGLCNMLMWGNAVGQALLTAQAGTGNLIAFGSFLRPVHNPFRIAVAVLWQSVCFSTVFALTTACSLSLMDWDDTQAMGYQAGYFVPLGVYASLLSRTSIAGPLAVVFLLCVLLLGLENLAVAVQVLYSILWDVAVRFRGKRLGIVIGLGLIACSAPLMLGSAYNTIIAIDQAAVAVVVPLFVGLQCIAAGYFWAEKSILATLRERAVPSGCPTIRAFLSIAYQHSIGKMQEVILAQGRSLPLFFLFPVFIKIVVPAAVLTTSIGSAVYLGVDAFGTLGVAAYVTGAIIVLGMPAFVFVSAVVTRGRDVVAPWEAVNTDRAVEAIGSPGPAVDERGVPNGEAVDMRIL